MKKIFFVLLTLLSISSFGQVGLSVDQKVEWLYNNSIFNQKLRQTGYTISVDGVYTPFISSGGNYSATGLTIRGNDQVSISNHAPVYINPTGGRTTIGSSTSTATYNSNVLNIGVGVGLGETPVINLVNSKDHTSQMAFYLTESETANTNVANSYWTANASAVGTNNNQVSFGTNSGNLVFAKGSGKVMNFTTAGTTTLAQITANSTFSFIGSGLAYNTVSTATGYTVVNGVIVILADATSGTFNITLQNAGTVDANRVIVIKKTDASANAVGILTGASTQTIDGTDNSSTPNTTLLPGSARGCVTLMQSSTTGWVVIGKY